MSEAPEVVRLCDISLNSEAAVLDALAGAAEEQGVVHDVILMLEMGDRREGVPPEDLIPLAATAMKEPSLRLAGIGANSCAPAASCRRGRSSKSSATSPTNWSSASARNSTTCRAATRRTSR
ncbi:MAG: alanine racemase [Rhizobiaceae bacterium]